MLALPSKPPNFTQKARVSVLFGIGRTLLALLFLGGAAQKVMDPETSQSLLASFGLPAWFIYPALVYNGLAGFALLIGFSTKWVALSLALYCIVTSIFHLIPSDGWQMSIFVKNWAIAGGLLVLADHKSAQHA